MVDQDKYVLEARPDGWGVRFNGKVVATFKTRSEALKAAVQAAHGSSGSNVKAEVLAPDANGILYSVWRSERDGYVPDDS